LRRGSGSNLGEEQDGNKRERGRADGSHGTSQVTTLYVSICLLHRSIAKAERQGPRLRPDLLMIVP